MKYIFTILAVAFLTATTQSQGLYSLNYTVGFTDGETADYISNPSFRGVSLDGRSFLTDQFSVGGYINWSTFYEKFSGSFTDGTATLTSTQYRYLNAFPVLVQAHYYLETDEYEPRAYLGAGTGAYKMVQRVEIGTWALEENHWHFGLSPEVGVLLPVSMDSHLNISARYHYVFKVDDTINYSWFGLSVGFTWGE